MSFPPKVAEKALLDCGRHCCICHTFCGFKIELHHIVQKTEDGEDTYENCIPLCLNCHAEVKAYDPKHPKGRKYTNSELRSHRDRWYEKVKNTPGVVLTNPDYIELDKKLFFQIRELLPSNGSIAIVREHDYGGSFDREWHKDLSNFRRFCKGPEVEFLDIDMEGLRVRLDNDIGEFWSALGEYTFTLDVNPGWNRIPRDPTEDRYLMSDYREIAKNEEEFNSLLKERRLYIYETQRKLNTLAQNIIDTYDNFIRLGRRKYAV